jgi:hypothetical protein
VYDFDGTSWTQSQIIGPPDGLPWTNVGGAVKLRGDWLAIGAPEPTNGVHFGGAWILRRDSEQFRTQRRLVLPGLGAGTGFATRVALVDDGDAATVFVQAPKPIETATVHQYDAAPIDCDESGYDDACELAQGFVADANRNGVPDACDSPADLNGDGVVNGADLGLLLSAWGSGGLGDLDGSGTVDGSDLGLLLAAWGDA